VSVIANLSRRPAGFKRPSITDKDEFNAHPDIKLLLHDIRQDRPYFQPKIVPDHLGTVICVKPMLDNPRVIRQDGAFLLFGIDGDKTKPATLERHSVVVRIKINKDKKKELAVQLEALGISRATLFPEIEQVATHIKAIYETPDLSLLSKLTEQQTKVIHALASGVAKNLREVATQLGVTPASVSQSIGNLYGKKLIERVGSGRGVRWQAIDAVKANLDKGCYP
jgi:DNA-binding transcriptional ArsR family regulator